MNKEDIIEKIIKLRLAQLFINEKYKEGAFKVPIHLALGYESIAVAVNSVMDENDSLFLTHRNIHYNLLRIENIKSEIDEYLLKETGAAKGTLGSMNFSNPKRKIMYSSSILGNNFSVGTGFALANKAKNKLGTVFIVTGDGAIEEGAFWECLVFLKSNNLNTIIIVENNQWSLGTKIEERRCSIELQKISASLSIPFFELNGNNPFEYITKIKEYKQIAKEEQTPLVMEVHVTALGYRIMKSENFPDGKFINYHAGPAQSLSVNDYPLILNTDDDPLFILSKFLEKNELMKISSRLYVDMEKNLK